MRIHPLWFGMLLVAVASGAPGAEPGYPRVMSFRQQSPASLPQFSGVDLLVSDLHVHTRQYSEEAFKQQHPEARVLVQFNNEGLGLSGTWFLLPKQRFESLGLLDPAWEARYAPLKVVYDGVYPLLDFPGHWTLDAGADTRADIPAGAETVTVKVSDTAPFQPSNYRLTLNNAREAGNPPHALDRDVVLYARLPDGGPDWATAEFASVKGVDPAAGTVTLLRWKTAGSGRAFPAGSHIAPNAVLQFDGSPLWRGLPAADQERLSEFSMVKPWLPNYTSFCPKDPRTGLTAAQTLAKHYLGVKTKRYPLSDGFVFDVSVSCMTPGDKLTDRVDADHDGAVDNFRFQGVNHYPLGYYDFGWYLRHGLPGAFEGMPGLLLVWDSNGNDDQRFFDLFNGGEYEHRMIMMWAPHEHLFSSNLDRLLLWAERAVEPRLTFVHNKYPDEAWHGGDAAALRRPCTLADFRLDIAASCMADGYIGKWPGRVTGETPESALEISGKKKMYRELKGLPPLPYDEFTGGALERRHWLGAPVGKPRRVARPAGKTLFQWSPKAALPAVTAEDTAWRAAAPTRTERGFSVRVEKTGRFTGFRDQYKLRARLPLGVEVAPDTEYTLRLKAGGESPWAGVDARYAGIPRNVHVRLTAGEEPFRGKPGGDLSQEFLVFPTVREVVLTLRAPRGGAGFLEFGLAEDPGTVEFSDLALSRGCADVWVREFEHGLAALNGSYLSPARIDLAKLLPGKKFIRFEGAQAPEVNNGQPVGAVLEIPPLDGILLLKEKVAR